MRHVLKAGVLWVGLCLSLMFPACDRNEAGNQPIRGQVVRESAPKSQRVAPKKRTHESRNEPGKLRQVDDAKTRYESGRPEDLQGLEQAAAPLRYATTSIRMRGHARDTLDQAQATRALNYFKAMKDRLPKSIKELREYGKENGLPVPEPADDGVYVLDKTKSKLIIVDPDTLK